MGRHFKIRVKIFGYLTPFDYPSYANDLQASGKFVKWNDYKTCS